MYTPSVPPPANNNPPTTTHLHTEHETLTEHENNDLYKTFLAGRHLAYSNIISDIYQKITNARHIQERNPHDSALWAITEGQIEGLKEILTILKEHKDTPK